MDFLVVKSITGSKTLSYLPLLNYTDKSSDNLEDLFELSKDNNFQIRALNFQYKDFKENDTITMRLDISSFDQDYVFMKLIKSKCRNQIRKSKKSDLELKIGGDELIDDFYTLFNDTMHKYGTPTFSKKLFYLIIQKLDSKIFIVYKDNTPISALLLICDNDISIVLWAASNNEFSKFCPNHLMYYEAINYSINEKKKVFDFGKSGYLIANTYKFKEQWGAKPVKIDILSSNTDDIYSKYNFASKVWRKLPLGITNILGPKLCKYLVDL
jgi:lipid II:glycine glycyltransferase (peptidoglycan interpeptide bridge formation enzyme)